MLAPLAGVTPTCSTTPRQEELFWQLFPTSPSCLFSACPSSAPAPGPLPSTRATSALLSFGTSHPRVAPAHPVLSCTSVPSHRLPRFLGSGLSASSPDTCPAPPPASLHRPLGPAPPGRRLRPHPAPGPPRPHPQPGGPGGSGERPAGGRLGGPGRLAYLSMASSFSSSSFCRSITARMMFLSSSVRWLRSGSSGIGGGTVGGRGPRGPTAEDIFAAWPAPPRWPGFGASAPSDPRPAAAASRLGSPRRPPGGGTGQRASPGCHGPPPAPSPGGGRLCFGGPGEARAPGRLPQPSLPGRGRQRTGPRVLGARRGRSCSPASVRPRCGRRVWVALRRGLRGSAPVMLLSSQTPPPAARPRAAPPTAPTRPLPGPGPRAPYPRPRPA